MKTKLHDAAENGHYDCVESLVIARADSLARDPSNHTPLDCSLQQKRGQWEHVSKFLILRQDVQQRELPIDSPAGCNPAEETSTAAALTSPFWIDAICIDQLNVAERNAQVAMMPTIYRNAASMLMWLGAQDATDATVIGRVLMSKGEQKSLKLQNNEECTQQRLRLMINSYFNRVWIVQELCLARKISVVYGDLAMDWTDLIYMFKMLIKTPLPSFSRTHTPLINAAGGSNPAVPDLYLLMTLRAGLKADPAEQQALGIPQRSPVTRLSLPLLLALSWSLQASEQSDYIYALLSLAKPIQGSPDCKVDYTEPVDRLFPFAASQFIKGSANERFASGVMDEWEDRGVEPLEALSYIQNGPYPEHHFYQVALPSWVPNLSKVLISRHIFDLSLNAATQMPLVLELVDSADGPDAVLRVSALVIDSIQTMEQRSAKTIIRRTPDHDAFRELILQLPTQYLRT